MPFGEPDRLAHIVEPEGSDAHDARHPRFGRALHGLVGAALDAVQVGVGVDHAASVSTRGKSGPADPSTRAPGVPRPGAASA